MTLQEYINIRHEIEMKGISFINTVELAAKHNKSIFDIQKNIDFVVNDIEKERMIKKLNAFE